MEYFVDIYLAPGVTGFVEVYETPEDAASRAAEIADMIGKPDAPLVFPVSFHEQRTHEGKIYQHIEHGFIRTDRVIEVICRTKP